MSQDCYHQSATSTAIYKIRTDRLAHTALG